MEDFNVSDEQLKLEEYIYDADKQPDVDIINGGSILVNFLRSIKPGADLVGALAPTFSLKPFSFLEWISVLLEPKDFLLELPKIDSAEKRMLTVLRYVLEATATMPQNGVQQVKGYNSILGETFECSWKHESSTSSFFSEQVSHHPPISAAYIENKTAGIQIEIIFQPKVKFVGSFTGPYVQSHLEGNAYIHIPSLKEVYKVDFPHFVCRNLIFGGSYCELNDEMKITSSSGYEVIISYKSKSNNKLSGEVTLRKEKVCSFDGISNQKVTCTGKSNLVLFDIKNVKRSPRYVKPLSEQSTNESRRVWHTVTKSIYKKNLELATKYKTLIEENERKVKKERDSNGEKWTPRYFSVLKKEDGHAIHLGPSTLYYRYNDFEKFQSSDKAE